jgi:hypothetical protein
MSLLLLTSISCTNQAKKSVESKNKVTLIPSGQILKMPIDNNTTLDCIAMFYHRDNDAENEYLTYLNSYKNEIQFYDLKLQELASRVTIATEGPNKIGKVSGFKVVNQDSIYITMGYSMFLVNHNGQIIKKSNFKDMMSGVLPTPYFSTSRIYCPLVIRNEELYIAENLIFNKSYLPQNAKKYTPNSKICLVVRKNGKCDYLPMEHPLASEESLSTVHFSREFDENNFIYSFFADPHIYVTIDHINVEKYHASSKYIGKIKHIRYKTMPSIEKVNRDFVTNGYYHNITYDPYRELYYRFVKLPDNYANGDDLMKLVKYPQNFSIIVLNKNFQVIGETKLPSKTFVFTDFFVAEKGLYISINHIDNPNLDIDHLQFELIKVQYNEK